MVISEETISLFLILRDESVQLAEGFQMKCSGANLQYQDNTENFHAFSLTIFARI